MNLTRLERLEGIRNFFYQESQKSLFLELGTERVRTFRSLMITRIVCMSRPIVAWLGSYDKK